MFLRIKSIVLICFVAVILGGVVKTASAQTQANKAVVDRWLELWITGDLAISDEIFAAHFVSHIPHYPDAADLEGYKAEIAKIPMYVADFHATLEDVIAQGDKVAGRFTAGGTMLPLGVPYTNTWLVLFRFADGRIVEEWWEHDLLGVQQQLGAIPPTRDTYTWGEPSVVAGDPGALETNKTTVQRMITEVFSGNLAVVDELFATGYIMHDPVWPTEVRGPQGFKQWAGAMLEPYFSESHIAAEMIAEGDRVAVRWTWSGTHTGEAMGVPATGRRISVTGMSVHRFANSKIVESWASYDALGMMEQLTTEDWPQEAAGPAGMVFVDIPGGTFEMGDGFGDGDTTEQPVHVVTVSSFKLSKYEVTNAQYAEYLNSAMAYGLIKVVDNMVYAASDEADLHYLMLNTLEPGTIGQILFTEGRFSIGSRNGLSMADHPVVAITWYGAKAFCDYYGYRLPTEAEWEYAARGGFHAPYYKYPWGSNSADPSQLNCCLKNPVRFSREPMTTPVDYYPAYGYGLCSMAGNVSEWCNDGWAIDYYYESSPQQDPQGPPRRASRVLRGGNWAYDVASCRISGRGNRAATWYCPHGAAGFRPALDMLGISPRRPAEPGLIAHWRLDDAEGVVAEDSVGDHTATVTGDAVWQPDGGRVGGALELDGIDDSVLTNITLNPANGPFSILAWVKGGAPGQVIVSDAFRRRGKCPEWSWLAVDPVHGTLTTDLVRPGSPPSAPDVIIADGQWHRVALVWDDSSRISIVYVDDVEVAAHVEPTLPTIYEGLQIGVGRNRDPATFWTGLIDDVRLYNRAVKP